MVELVLAGATVVDGTGRPRFSADLAIEGGRIAAIGDLADAEALQRIDVGGQVVAPGFIDMHSHSELMLLIDPRGLSKIHQGVTTEVVGNCGFSPAPLLDSTAADIKELHGFFGQHILNLDWEWRSMDGFLSRLEDRGTGLNVAALVGHIPLRVAAMGFEQRPATSGEVARMRGMLRQALDQGAFGFSSGLIYPPSSFAETDELVDLCRELRPFEVPYFTHIRGEGHSLLRAVSEAIEIGERAGVSVQIAHHKATYRANWGRINQAIQLSEWAQDRGQDVTFDVYPYTAGSSTMTHLLPDWAQGGGLPRLMERLADPAARAVIRSEVEAQRLIWEDIFVSWIGSEDNKQFEGLSLAAVGAARSQEPVDALLDLLLEERGCAMVVLFIASEADLEYVLSHRLSMIGSDGWAVSPDGPLSEGKPHPRCYGTFPRVLGHYVREAKLLSLEEAVRKMTSAPAEKLHLKSKGRLAPGMDADLVVFDPISIGDRATYAQPHQFPSGVTHVMVNGELAVKDGKHTGALPGRVLRR